MDDALIEQLWPDEDVSEKNAKQVADRIRKLVYDTNTNLEKRTRLP